MDEQTSLPVAGYTKTVTTYTPEEAEQLVIEQVKAAFADLRDGKATVRLGHPVCWAKTFLGIALNRIGNSCWDLRTTGRKLEAEYWNKAESEATQ